MSESLVSVQQTPLAEGGYMATSEELQGLIAYGRTSAETLEIAQDVARKLVEVCIQHGDELPASLREKVTGTADLWIPVALP